MKPIMLALLGIVTSSAAIAQMAPVPATPPAAPMVHKVVHHRVVHHTVRNAHTVRPSTDGASHHTTRVVHNNVVKTPAGTHVQSSTVTTKTTTR